MSDKKRKERMNKLAGICKTLNTGKFGGENKDAVTFFGGGETKKVEVFKTGAKSLDIALGGGWPRGRVCEIYGPESGGKSTLCLHAIAEFQKKFPDEDVAIIDSEHSFDVEYAKNLNVDVEFLIIHQPESGEQALNIAEQLIGQGVKMIVVDSVAALTTTAELEGDIGDAKVATTARLMSTGLKRLVAVVNRANAFMLFTNQIRDNIGVMYGAKTITPGGKALKFYSSCRVEVRKIGVEKEGENIVATKVQANVVKNKVAPPFKKANFIITFGIGVDQIAAILDMAIEKKIVKKSGAWMKLDGETIAQGRASLLDKLRENEDGLRDKIEKILQDIEDSENKEKEEKAEKKTKKSPVVDEEEDNTEDFEEEEIEVEEV
jgi:recombination protein RecA